MKAQQQTKRSTSDLNKQPQSKLPTERQSRLTEQQELEAIQLFRAGGETATYVNIAKQLNVPYGLVNKFMTKWKKHMGVLKTRPERKKSKTQVTTHKVYVEQPYKDKAELKEELKFLRGFYLRNMSAELSH